MAGTLSDREIRLRVQTIPERFQDRFPQDYPRLSRDRDSGEWEEVVENLLAALHQDRAPVSTRERDELHQLVSSMNLPRVRPEWLAGLETVPSLSREELIEHARTLPERYASRIPESDHWELTTPRDAGDWDDLAENLVRLLHDRRVSISDQEQSELWLILDALDLPRQKLRELRVT